MCPITFARNCVVHYIFIYYCYFFLDHCGQLQPLAFLKYKFDRVEHAIEVKSHGNTIKKEGPFSRTKASTLLKKGLDNNPPVKVLQQVENIKGGVLGASSLCDLP